MDKALHDLLAYVPLIREWYVQTYDDSRTTPREKAAALIILHENRSSVIGLVEIAQAVGTSHGTVRYWQTRNKFIEEKYEAASSFAFWLLHWGAGDLANPEPLAALHAKAREVRHTIPHLARWAARECYRDFLLYEPGEEDSETDLGVVQELAMHFAAHAYGLPMDEAFEKAIDALFAKPVDARVGFWQELMTALKWHADPELLRLRLALAQAQRNVERLKDQIQVLEQRAKGENA
jgi:hypothetical protein